MPIRLGYAALNTQLPGSNRTLRLRNATPERIIALGRQNLAALLAILEWNRAHGIRVFRISSDIIPFGSHPVNDLPWWEVLEPELTAVGTLVRTAGMRVSMHPGQFTVINSIRPEVVESSAAELVYHARLLDALGVDTRHKIVIHLGGVYGDKAASLRRFSEAFARLPANVQSRLVVENDEKNYTLADALAVSERTGAPVVFDIFHHGWNPSLAELSLRGLVERAAGTWKESDGRPKLHYSDPWPGKPPGSHSQSVDVEAFAAFYRQVGDLEIDVMLEVKDKEQSVLRLYELFPELRAE
ncbi:MAG TPA: UV DNA damage repair endonuclease UvsE [Anaerolineaceae bacterium]|nr:UV DNA damage repair endonuclease UvsE [Anaerolineaceae bacterium]